MEEDKKTNGDKPSVFSNRSKIHELEKAMVEFRAAQVGRFRREQQMLDQHLDEKLAARDKGIKESLVEIIDLLTAPKPGKDSSAAISGGPGIILSQKQVVAGVTALALIVILLGVVAAGVDGDTVGAIVTKWLGP